MHVFAGERAKSSKAIRMSTQTMDLAADALHGWLDEASDEALDALPFGVVGIDREGLACRYNQYEVRMAHFQPSDVIGRKFFEDIARCMDNGMVAGRLAQAVQRNEALDASIDYVIAFRSGRTRARLRLLHAPASPTSYLLLERLGETSA